MREFFGVPKFGRYNVATPYQIPLFQKQNRPVVLERSSIYVRYWEALVHFHEFIRAGLSPSILAAVVARTTLIPGFLFAFIRASRATSSASWGSWSLSSKTRRAARLPPLTTWW